MGKEFAAHQRIDCALSNTIYFVDPLIRLGTGIK
jgi:hypothetical protein